jgi:polyhydroxyalkanoate synthesis regulator phasin
MDSFFKDLAVLLFSAGEEIEKKAKEFKETREERYKEFEKKINEKKEEFKVKHGEDINKMKDKMSGVASNLGLATKSEIDEIKKMVSEINKKLDAKK